MTEAQVEPVVIQRELEDACRSLDNATDELYKNLVRFESRDGPGTLYEIAIQSQLIKLHDEAVEQGKRPPAEDIRRALAERAVRVEQPDLYDEWRELSTKIEAARIYISGRKAAISGRQSVLRGERG